MRARIVILSFGGPSALLVARRVRAMKIGSLVLPSSTSLEEIRALNPCGIVLSGGPLEGSDTAGPPWDPGVFSLGVPILGIGYGMELIVLAFGGKAEALEGSDPEIQELSFDGDCALFRGLPPGGSCRMYSRRLSVSSPAGFVRTAGSEAFPVAAMADESRGLYGLLFHPEREGTRHGALILEHFVKRICGSRTDWDMGRFAQQAVARVRETVGDGTVLLGLSGGVDSAVTAALIYRAVGSRLHCVFVDHGFMRKDEPRLVKDVFTRIFPVSLTAVDAAERFMRKLRGVSDPEQKRRIIGAEFIEVFRDEAKKLGPIQHFAQGTIYPDVIESGAVAGATAIKSHHNVGGLPKELGFTSLIEPLRMLFKEEVRELGRHLGLPNEVLKRQPFPGPGLAIRVIGDLTRERVDMVRESDAILRQEIERAGLGDRMGQYFTVLTGIRSVGIAGDSRSYDQAVAVRAVTTDDFLTADWARIPYETLALVSRRIVGEVPGVNRVLLDVTNKPPASIEWE